MGLVRTFPASWKVLNFMKKETKRSLRELAYYSSLGLSVSLAIFIGLAVGVYLDRRFETSPWCTLVFLVLGIIGGFRNIAIVLRKTRKYE
jgi:ATP synthase protein I